MPLTADEVLKEIRYHIPSFDTEPADVQETCVRIAQFLYDGGARLPNFLGLEHAMLTVITTRIGNVVPVNTPAAAATEFLARTNTRLAGAGKAPVHLQGVLSTVLSQVEGAHGFAPAALFTGFVQPDIFRTQISEGKPFKDPTVPYGHGEFTHRIQWYLVFKGVQAPNSGWGPFYRWVGGMVSIRKPKAGLWDMLFDRNKDNRPQDNGPFDTEEAVDFRSPENLHKHLRHLMACPVLRGFIEGRHRKRKNQGMIERDSQQVTIDNFNNDAVLKDYLSRKVFGVPYNQLPLMDRPAVATVTQKNVLIRGAPLPVSPPGALQGVWRQLIDSITI